MEVSPREGPESITARFALRMPGGTLQAEMTVPTGPTRVDQILPLAQALADRVISVALNVVEAEGRTVSCRAGCGACCRQLVPIAEAEARHIRDLVEGLPEPRRSRVRARFAEALRRFGEAGLLEALRQTDILDKERRRQVGLDYFHQHIACPFLEDESCSIHPDRPIACREYLVTSPPENCAAPKGGNVEGVSLPTHVWTAVARFDPPHPGATSIRWVPLVRALEWAEEHPELPEPRPGPELLRDLIGRVVRGEGEPAG
jgi:Fe-S-cluster containining protein